RLRHRRVREIERASSLRQRDERWRRVADHVRASGVERDQQNRRTLDDARLRRGFFAAGGEDESEDEDAAHARPRSSMIPVAYRLTSIASWSSCAWNADPSARAAIMFTMISGRSSRTPRPTAIPCVT